MTTEEVLRGQTLPQCPGSKVRAEQHTALTSLGPVPASRICTRQTVRPDFSVGK